MPYFTLCLTSTSEIASYHARYKHQRKVNDNRSGYFRKTTSGYKAFFPQSLPLEREGSNVSSYSCNLWRQTALWVNALNMVISVLPNSELLTGMFIQKEALLSSQIEGTQSSLVDVLGAEEEHPPTKDVGEVLNYVRAARHGLKRLKEDDLPLCLRLIKEMHQILMDDVRGGSANPRRVSSAPCKIGWGKPAPPMRVLCRHRRVSCRSCWAILSNT